MVLSMLARILLHTPLYYINERGTILRADFHFPVGYYKITRTYKHDVGDSIQTYGKLKCSDTWVLLNEKKKDGA